MEAANRLWTSLGSWNPDENRVFHNLNQLLLSDWSREISEIVRAFTCEGCQVALGQLLKNTLQCNTYSKSNKLSTISNTDHPMKSFPLLLNWEKTYRWCLPWQTPEIVGEPPLLRNSCNGFSWNNILEKKNLNLPIVCKYCVAAISESTTNLRNQLWLANKASHYKSFATIKLVEAFKV